MSLQRIPHDTTRYANNPVELINIANRQRIGIETVSDTSFKTLLHFDGTNGSTTFTDSSGLGLSFSAIGDANLNTSNYKFGTASGYFDGGNDYLACSTIWDFGTSDWTIDFWGKITGGSAGAGIFGGLEGANQFIIYFNRNDNYINLFNDHASYPYTACYAAFDTALTDAFHHIAIVRSSTSILFFLDGVKKTTGGTQIGTDPICNLIGYNKVVGNMYYGGTNCWQGYIDEFAIRNYAVWTDSFTLPSSAYSASSTKYHNYIGA